MAKIIILNAPPGAGKDTIGKMLAQYSPIQCSILSFKAPMFNIALAILGNKRYLDFLDEYNDRERKEKPKTFLMGMSPREFMIWISEDVIKPKFGKDYFGVMFNERIKDYEGHVICTDGGFSSEIIALINAGHEVKLCRLHRDGFAFAGDSRNYIRINPYYWKNGYSEHDYTLKDGKPLKTVGEIIRDHLK